MFLDIYKKILAGPIKENPNTHLKQTSSFAKRPVILVTLIESSTEERERALNRHINSRFYRPVFITTTAEIGDFLIPKATFEYLQPLSEIRRHPNAGAWTEYIQQQWRLINAKWQPLSNLEYGIPIENYLTRTKSPTQTDKRRAYDL